MSDLQKRWLSAKEACQYAKIGKERIKRLAALGMIKGCPDPDNKRGDWIFDRLSIDEYRSNQMSGKTIREKALEILRGLGHE